LCNCSAADHTWDRPKLPIGYGAFAVSRAAVSALRARGAKEGADILGEKLGLFRGGEVASARHLYPTLYVIAALDPLPRRERISFGK
jgi:hypothetical protein